MADPKIHWPVTFAPQVAGHMVVIERKHHRLIQDAIEERLSHEPLVETTNRKPLKRSSAFEDAWELRVGPGNRFRIFYHVDEEHHAVCVVAIGVKDRNRLFIGGEEIEL